jgi:hypothetical protein
MYPVEDIGHARAAIMRVMQHGTPDEKYAVRKAVYSMYPQLIPHSRINLYAKYPRTRRGEITGKLNLINFMQKENAEGRKVRVFYAGMDKGRPSYRYESWGILPHLKKTRTAMLAREQASNATNHRIKKITPMDKIEQQARSALKHAGGNISLSEARKIRADADSGLYDRNKNHVGLSIGAKEKLETIETPHGSVSFKSTNNCKRAKRQKIFVPGAPNIQRHGTDIGAGVYREGKRQHINLEG